MIHIDEDLGRQGKYTPCEYCCAGPPSEWHHLWSRGAGGGTRLDVHYLVIFLCRLCHQKAEAKIITRAELCELVLKRETWRLRALPKETKYLRGT